MEENYVGPNRPTPQLDTDEEPVEPMQTPTEEPAWPDPFDDDDSEETQ
jgi:hypothetical protein